jgi:Tfp pilus assembly protein PilF
VHEQPADADAAYAVIYHSPSLKFKIIDGQLMSRRLSLDGTESRFLDIWSGALSPAASGLTGAPVITSDGKVAGMCDLISGNAKQRYVIAIPEAPIIAVVQRARRAKRPLPFPASGAISVTGVPQGEAYRGGMKQIATGDLRAALESFRTALKDNPENPLAMTQEAFCQVSLGNYEEARKLLEKVRVVAPKRLRARTLLGHVLEAMGEHENAEACFRELTIDAPQLDDGWMGLGLRQLNAGNAVAAEMALKKCTELVPESMENWNRYAQALAETGKYSESYEAMEKVSDLESLLIAAVVASWRVESPGRWPLLCCAVLSIAVNMAEGLQFLWLATVSPGGV